MANLKDIRDRIKSIRNIQQVTKAMKMVAAAKLRRAQERMEQARPYEERLSQVIHSLLPDVDRSLLPLLDVREVKRIAMVVFTSDRGLAGSFNSSVVRRVEEEIQTSGKVEVDLICVGRRGQDYFRKRDYNVVKSHTDFWSDLNFTHAMEFGEDIIEPFVSGKIDEVHVVYNWFRSVGTQEIRMERLLPLVYEGKAQTLSERLYEPSKDDLICSLIPRHMNVEMWKYLLESYASEQAARMVAMDNATENAGELIHDLRLEFNKLRQAAITKEVLEIISGAEALKVQ
ncbi:MAG TPA: ATP synthase F1 subunit gamma [Candidatus Marinimicrobia bacterium]|jgi:F-type H+-transporting ATPase subunit gamma|nr:ATP synthase F1 subunit gamma [Candidatus Neomarinimicrobiota bacterium]MDP7654334.1 ATP synthase F1 subunit gamma [Candidatus Neomarinimicrobiota bacterium]HJL84796.1 ATP synthase F1 subunit gamma [Candidatus Neomarinimicrobiota bacterium]|tara:strand:- start:2124 stop:2981 length:858 start_codon:yes stop_codon:yes gene_type:complete